MFNTVIREDTENSIEIQSEQRLRSSFVAVRNKVNYLKKHKNRDQEILNLYLTSQFDFYKSSSVKRKSPILETKVDESPKKIRVFEYCGSKCSENHKAKICELASRNKHLTSQLTALQKENKKLRSRIKKLGKKVNSLSAVLYLKRANQAKKRLKKSVCLWKGKYKELLKTSSSVGKLEKQLVEAKKDVSRLKKAKSKERSRLENKISKAGKIDEQLVTELVHREAVIKEKNETILSLENLVCAKTQEQSPDIISTKQDGKTFKPEIREASYSLQNLGVPQSKVSAAIKVVAKAVTGNDIEDLPSYSTQNNLSREMCALSRQHVKEAVTSGENLTLKYDGTCKKIGHLVEVELSTEDQTYLIGLKDQVSGKADNYVETIKNSFKHIEQTPIPNAELDKDLNILNSITNTMTDRSITNSSIDRKLEELKGSDINKFRCAMHPLDSMAKGCEKVVKQYEISQKEFDQSNKKMPYLHRGESFTQGLIRIVSKIFHNTQYSCNREHVKYLKDLEVTSCYEKKAVLYHRFVGNRFHIYFLNAGLLYLYFDHIKIFFSSFYSPKNSVHTAILNALHVEKVQVTLRALGIIGKCVTGPYMRLASTDNNILYMNSKYLELRDNLKSWTHDASPLVSSPPPSVFVDFPVISDPVLDCLMPQTQDRDILKLLQDLSRACLDVVNRQLSSQLPGGEFWQPSPRLIAESKSCQSSNISEERNFAHADSEIYRARNAKVGFVEGRVMFKKKPNNGLV